MRLILTYLLLCFALPSVAHEHNDSEVIKFQENKGQWNSDLWFYAKTADIEYYVGDGRFMMQLKNRNDFDLAHHCHHSDDELPDDFAFHFHNIQFELIATNASKPSGEQLLEDYVNYFLGNDTSRWAGGVNQYSTVRMPSVYPGIDFILSSLSDHLKYEFQLKAGANPTLIKFKISGADRLMLIDQKLLLANTIGLLTDDAPIGWQEIDGVKSTVNCRYQLNGDTLSFVMDEYDSSFPLVIDPTLIFSSYTGSNPTDNWGSTATYDSTGNLYAGGIVLNSLGGSMNGYPTTTGAFQTTYAGGQTNGANGGVPYGTDIVISKFNSSGSSLVYSTYLGGDGNEIPHSLVVNDNNQLYVLGTTSSSDFPVTSSAYDQTFNGGSLVAGSGNFSNKNSNDVGYLNGSDIIVTKFNSNGTALVASTYIGGAGNDGLNLSDTLQKAYSDECRGEIIVDANDNCFVATSSGSTNFPIVSGFQNTYAGGLTDGVVFKFNSNLSSLLWSTYIGGSEADGAYSLQFDPSGNVFVTGGTKSNDFPTTNGVLNPNYLGGVTDGWVSKISGNGQTLMASTFLGTNNYDQSFFVQLDVAGNVYCVGQSLGSYPVGPSWVYSNANSGQFLHKLTNNLQSTVFSTRWGSGNSNINLSLSAFLVNQCNHIFVAGWGGTLFGVGASTSTGGTTTTGLTTTSNAYQTTTDGRDMYFIVFEDSAKAVIFASFFGGTGNSGQEHVDGGTSRFDKKGIIYQAVCAGCGGGNAFPTTTGAYATNNGSNNCNLGVLKYDLVTLIAEADIDGPAEVCINDSLQFENQSFGGSIYLWEFGDGATSDEFEPKHAYSAAGQYTVRLVIYDSVSCIFSDTDLVQVNVVGGPTASVGSVPVVCPGTLIQLNASGGTSYQWTPINGLNNPNSQNPTALITEAITYIVAVTDSCGTDTAHVRVKVFPDKTSAMPDTSICDGLSGELWSKGGVSYQWSPSLFLTGANTARPDCAPDTTTHYIVTILDSFNCIRVHEVVVYVFGYVPSITAWGDTTVCQGERIILRARGTDDYLWYPDTWVLDPTLNNTPAYPEESIVYYVRASNACGTAEDSVVVIINPIEVRANPVSGVCFGDSVMLGAEGSVIYQWTGPELLSYNQYPEILPDTSAWYFVKGSNFNGCSRMDSLFVEVFPKPSLQLVTNADTISGLENVLLVAESTGNIHWSSSGYIPCESCDSILVYPLKRTIYYVKAIDSNLCAVFDSVEVEAISKIFAPNTFTPNGDKVNDVFRVYGHQIHDFEMAIYDRWGEVVYRSVDMSEGWNGKKFNVGLDSKIDVYTYEIRYTVLPEEPLVQLGKVLLLR